MSILVLGLLQLVCSSLGLSIESIVEQGKNAFSLDSAKGFVEGVMNESRHKNEIAKMPRGLGVYDDNDEFFEITNEENESTEYEGQITFKLYTYKNPKDGQELRINDTASLESSNFDANKKTYIVTHGWRNSGKSDACVLIRNAYVENTDYNVVVVDWSKYSMTINYIDAAYKTRVAGQEVAGLIEFLYRNELKPSKLNLIGHSLGAHVMGIASYSLRPDEASHIVGLDPALPMFNFADVGDGLSKEDAERVQIIHTNAGALGYICSRGHTDFFPNGGVTQEGCCGLDPVRCASCSHSRAYKFFAESITRSFNASRCDSYASFESNHCSKEGHIAPMGGLDLDLASSGTYYLRTGKNEPYSEPEQKSFNPPKIAPFFANSFCETALRVT